ANCATPSRAFRSPPRPSGRAGPCTERLCRRGDLAVSSPLLTASLALFDALDRLLDRPCFMLPRKGLRSMRISLAFLLLPIAAIASAQPTVSLHYPDTARGNVVEE